MESTDLRITPKNFKAKMMEIENRMNETFDALEDLPDELEGQENNVLLEEDEEGSGQVVTNGGSHGRVIKKAKRPSKASSFSEDGKMLPTQGLKNLNRVVKNSRKSRNNLGRGLPKKGGAGGKGTWGKLGGELDLPWVDPNDPNYDSDTNVESENAKKKKTTVKLNSLVPEMSEEDVRKAVEPLVLEYFENGDTTEVLFSLEEMLHNLGMRRWMVGLIAIELALDHKPSHREMTSQLISELYLKVISQRDIGKAFDSLLRQLPDLMLDTPDAPHLIGNFMARAIADDCIPPKFLHSYKGNVEDAEAKKSLCRADTLLNMKHGLVRLDNVWGVGGGIRPVKYLVKKIVLLLKEYLCSGDVKEASRCLADLEVPHFHHELVYEAVIMVIESMHEKTEESMCKLLQSLFQTFVITIDQMRNGFQRAYDQMPDISIDVPAAYVILERWVLRCRQAGIVNDDIVRKMPSRGRKRFVSEGDGGRIKDSSFW
jgi:programmed cell death protein 4